MALEVPFLPPALALLLALAPLSPLSVPARAQETKAAPEEEGDVAAKARLLQELDQQIEERRQELARQAEGLAALQKALEAAKTALLEEKGRLEALKAEVEADIARRQKVVDARLDQIAGVYKSMKPREAAAALQDMDDKMAVSILERLQGRAVGKIFDLMPKARVRELTHRMEEGRPQGP